MTPQTEEEDEFKPDWALRYSYADHRPDWQDFVPHELWELGEVFFPIPRGEKAWRYPHHLQSHRHTADSDVLNAYFEQGWGYGIACAGDLAVVDIDELAYRDEVLENLPSTLWQQSGSREGEHHFFMVKGLETRQTLYAEFMDGWVHIGEVKCDPHGYVVGPGSLHPSGNRYGPLKGDEIATISIEELMDAIEPFQKPEPDHGGRPDSVEEWKELGDSDLHPFYELTADDVVPWLEKGKRIAHPVHGSTTGSNFMKNEGGETFTCWRCQYGSGDGCGLNGPQYLAVEATGMDCEGVRRNWYRDSSLHYDAWREAVDRELVGYSEIPYRVLHGYAVKNGIISLDEKIGGSLYTDVENAVKYEMDVRTHIR